MKIVIVSDSHGEIDLLRKIVNQHLDADVFLHLGDSQLPEQYLNPFCSVRGNGDFFLPYPNYRILHTPYGDFYCEHGHLRGGITPEFLKIRQCVGYLYGHTHCRKNEVWEGIHFINPGSLTRPRDGKGPCYIVMNCEKDKIDIQFIEV